MFKYDNDINAVHPNTGLFKIFQDFWIVGFLIQYIKNL
jgi:hypothetical protein